MDRRGGHGGGAWGARQWIGWALAWVVTAACAAGMLWAVRMAEATAAQAHGTGEAALPATAAAFTVVVDAGHGGMDVGASGTDTGVEEAGLNLAVAQRLQAELTARGVRVIMTREDDGALAASKRGDMEARREMLRDETADIVVSIHMNKYGDRSVSGAMAYYMQGSAEGERLAQMVIDSVCDAIDRDRRAANPGDYFVLRECEAPSVLVECGFLSNAEEEKKLQDGAYQQLLAEAIAAGVIAYVEGTQ